MNTIELPNRPSIVAPRTEILDFESNGKYFRVSMKLVDADGGVISIDVQAFEVDSSGVNKLGPDGRPSRTTASVKTVMASSLNDTHTMNPGWVRIVGNYVAVDFENFAQPTDPEIGDKWFNLATQTGYEYVEGEKFRIAKGAVNDMLAIIANSDAIAGIGF